jgi:hypothetical protein
MQIDFWPEEIRIRDIDRIDVSTIDDWNRYKQTDHVPRSWSFSDIKKETYYIYKTGGKNPYLPEVGPIFPYLLNADTNHIIKPTRSETRPYPVWNMYIHGLPGNFAGSKAKKILMGCHVLTALAFIKPNHPNQKIVAHQNEGEVEDHHLWYNLNNLKWSTQKDNIRSRFHFSTGGSVS